MLAAAQKERKNKKNEKKKERRSAQHRKALGDGVERQFLSLYFFLALFM